MACSAPAVIRNRTAGFLPKASHVRDLDEGAARPPSFSGYERNLGTTLPAGAEVTW